LTASSNILSEQSTQIPFEFEGYLTASSQVPAQGNGKLLEHKHSD